MRGVDVGRVSWVSRVMREQEGHQVWQGKTNEMSVSTVGGGTEDR